MRHVSCGPTTTICIAPTTGAEPPGVELRLCRASRLGLDPQPTAEAVTVPLAQLGAVIAELTALQQGSRPQPAPAPLPRPGIAPPPRGLGQPVRRAPRIPITAQLTCTTFPAPGGPPPATVLAQLRDVSVGGAQLALPIRLLLAQRLALKGHVAGEAFEAEAEVAHVARWTEREAGGGVRHGVRWRGLRGPAAELIHRLIS